VTTAGVKVIHCSNLQIIWDDVFTWVVLQIMTDWSYFVFSLMLFLHSTCRCQFFTTDWCRLQMPRSSAKSTTVC